MRRGGLAAIKLEMRSSLIVINESFDKLCSFPTGQAPCDASTFQSAFIGVDVPSIFNVDGDSHCVDGCGKPAAGSMDSSVVSPESAGVDYSKKDRRKKTFYLNTDRFGTMSAYAYIFLKLTTTFYNRSLLDAHYTCLFYSFRVIRDGLAYNLPVKMKLSRVRFCQLHDSIAKQLKKITEKEETC